MITSMSQLDMNKRYSVSDYLNWKIDERIELINGKIFKMSPAPSITHQEVSRNLAGHFWEYFKGHKCNYFVAPSDVFLENISDTGEKLKDTVVQPDLFVVCDLGKMKENGCHGAPDLVIEIISPSTARKDMGFKYDLYEEQGVKEYWVVYPKDGAVSIYRLEDGKYIEDGPFTRTGDLLKSDVVSGFKLLLDDVFNQVDNGNIVLEPRLKVYEEN